MPGATYHRSYSGRTWSGAGSSLNSSAGASSSSSWSSRSIVRIGSFRCSGVRAGLARTRILPFPPGCSNAFPAFPPFFGLVSGLFRRHRPSSALARTSVPVVRRCRSARAGRRAASAAPLAALGFLHRRRSPPGPVLRFRPGPVAPVGGSRPHERRVGVVESGHRRNRRQLPREAASVRRRQDRSTAPGPRGSAPGPGGSAASWTTGGCGRSRPRCGPPRRTRRPKRRRRSPPVRRLPVPKPQQACIRAAGRVCCRSEISCPAWGFPFARGAQRHGRRRTWRRSGNHRGAAADDRGAHPQENHR